MAVQCSPQLAAQGLQDACCRLHLTTALVDVIIPGIIPVIIVEPPLLQRQPVIDAILRQSNSLWMRSLVQGDWFKAIRYIDVPAPLPRIPPHPLPTLPHHAQRTRNANALENNSWSPKEKLMTKATESDPSLPTKEHPGPQPMPWCNECTM